MENLLAKVPNEIRIIAKTLRSHNRNSYLVGGAVVDLLEGRVPKDWDIEVFNITIEELDFILSRYPGAEIKRIGKKFGIIKFKVNGFDCEFSIPRKENKIGVGHAAFDVTFFPNMTIEEAARRRDFTVNAIYLDLFSGEIEDPFDGVKHLKEEVLDIIDEECFKEDSLRVFRAMRFISYRASNYSLRLINLCSKMKEECQQLSSDSVFQEWNKMFLNGKYIDSSIVFLQVSNLIDLYPELKALVECKQSPIHHREGNVIAHTSLVIQEAIKLRDNLPEEWKLAYMWAALLHDIGKPATTEIREDGKITSYRHDIVGAKIARKFMEKLTNNVQLIDKICLLVRYHMTPILFNGKTRLFKWKELHNTIPLQVLAYMCLADERGRIADDVSDKRFNKIMEIWRSFGAPEGKILALITGKDLIKLGYSEGKELGEKLKKLYSLQIKKNYNKEELLKRIGK